MLWLKILRIRPLLNTSHPAMTALSANDLAWFAARLSIAVYDVRNNPQMSVYELREALRGTKGIEDLTLTTAPNGNQIIAIDGKKLEFSPMASNDEIIAALQNPFIPTRNTRLTVSAIDRLKEKALRAKNIAPNAIKAFEADLDGLIAQEGAIETKRAAAIAPHQEAIAGVTAELDDLKAAMDILSNGAPA